MISWEIYSPKSHHNKAVFTKSALFPRSSEAVFPGELIHKYGNRKRI